MLRKTARVGVVMSRDGRSQSYQYFRAVPLRRLFYLFLAIFCLFAMVGFLIDIGQLGRKPLSEVLVWTMFTGAMAVFYVLTLIRSPRWFWLPLASHIAGSWLIRKVVVASPAQDFSKLPVNEPGIQIAVLGTFVLSMLAGGLFLQFIRGEGRRSVRLQTELSLAHGIQQTLVPEIQRKFAGWEVYGVSWPSEKVGGDLVDVVELQNGQVVAYVADIAGHGLAAGILMAMLKTAARTQLMDSPRLAAFFERLNDVLPEVKQQEMYATCAAVLLPNGQEDGTLEYALAGHPPIVRVHPEERQAQRLEDPQFPLGLIGNVVFTSHQLRARPGDLFLIATDGILETMDGSGEEFGLERVEKILLAHAADPLLSIARKLQSAARAFGGQVDDQTILLLRKL